MKKLFQPGISGNPAGRPRGIPDRRSRHRELLDPHIPEIVTKLVDLAKAGDTSAAKLILERTLPILRQQDMPAQLPITGESLAERAQSVIDATASGEIAPAEAESVMALLQGQARILDTSDLERRIVQLEQAQSK